MGWDSSKPKALAISVPKAGWLQDAVGSRASPQPVKGRLFSEAWSRHQFLWRTAWAASSGTSTAIVWVDGISFYNTVARGKYHLLGVLPELSSKADLLVPN